MDELADIQVVHFRCRCRHTGSGGRVSVLTKGGVSVAVRRIAATDDLEADLEAACAVCSACQSFNPVDGAKRAVARLLSVPHNGRKNSKLERWSDSRFRLQPALANGYPMGPGFSYIAELYDAGCIEATVVFAWAVAVNAVLTMKGGGIEERMQLCNTLTAIPRGVKVKSFPKKAEEKSEEKPA